MPHCRKCKYCGHRIIEVRVMVANQDTGTMWMHTHPHPDHVCKCTTPEPWVSGEDIKEKKRSLLIGGITSYAGGVQKEGYSE